MQQIQYLYWEKLTKERTEWDEPAIVWDGFGIGFGVGSGLLDWEFLMLVLSLSLLCDLERWFSWFG